MTVRRLAAIDMYGTRGTSRRRRIILAEFVLGVMVMVVFGAWLLTASVSLAGRALGLWMIGAGLNYAPLAVHAIMLSRPGALDAELAGIDTGRELRRYSVLQLWIFVPLSLLAVEVRDVLTRRKLRSSAPDEDGVCDIPPVRTRKSQHHRLNSRPGRNPDARRRRLRGCR